jgi:hypothetical protein
MTEVFRADYNASVEVERSATNTTARASGAGGGGWLLAIALTLGKIADAMGERMLKLAERIDTLQAAQEDNPKATIDANGTVDNEGKSGDGLTELNARLQVLGQQLGQMLQMLATIVKTIGEGNKDIARKQ